MSSYTIRKYSIEDQQIWDDFVKTCKNGSFLFQRGFMEYHSDRFVDFSLLIFKGNALVAVFPANIKDDVLYSHQGLTYGGVLMQKSIGGEKVKDILQQILVYAKEHKITKLIVKNIPVFYHQLPSNEFSFFLSDHGASIYRRDLNLAIDYKLPITFHKSKLKHYQKNKNLGFTIQEVNDFSVFWEQVLVPRLKEKHQVQPVHALEEIQLLKSRFPEHIKQYVISLDKKVMAGITVFKTKTVVKSQYGAVTAEGEKYRALDFLFIELIQNYKAKGYQYFDMGTVTERNYGLLKQKEELGCQIYTQDFYELNL